MFRICCAALLSIGAPAAASSLPADLAAAAHAYDRAQVKGDRAALQRLLADDYLLVDSRGGTETKAQAIAGLTAAGTSLDPFVVEQPVQRNWNGGAVLGGVVALTGKSAGKPFSDRLRFVDVWAKRGALWQLVFTQAAKLPEDSGR